MGRGGGKDEDAAGGMAAKHNRASALRCCALRILQALSQATMAASFVSVALVLSLRLSPSPWGWAFISFSLLSLLSASLGYLSFSLSLTSPSSSAPPPLYRLYLLISTLSVCVTGSSFILLLSNPSAVLNHLRSSRSDYDARVLLRADAAFLIAVFCLQVLVLLSSCALSHSGPTRRGYRDLEGKKLSGRVQELTEKEEEEEERKGKEEGPAMAITEVAEVASNAAKDGPLDTANAVTAAAGSAIAEEEEKSKVEEKGA